MIEKQNFLVRPTITTNLTDMADKDSGNKETKTVVDGDGTTSETLNDSKITDDTVDDIALNDNKITGDTVNDVALEDVKITGDTVDDVALDDGKLPEDDTGKIPEEDTSLSATLDNCADTELPHAVSAIPALKDQKINLVLGKSSAKIEKVLKSVTIVADSEMPVSNDIIYTVADSEMPVNKDNNYTVADSEMPVNKDINFDEGTCTTESKATDDGTSTDVSIKTEDVEESTKYDVSIIHVSDVDREIETDVNGKDFMCPIECSSKSKWTDEKKLASHLKTVHHLNENVTQRLTKVQFATEPLDSLSISDVPNCFLCGVKPPNPARFKDHMTSVHGLMLLYQCPLCLNTRDTVERLNVHLKNQHEKSAVQAFLFSDFLHPVLVNAITTQKFLRVSLDTQEKYDALRILRYLKDYNCSTDVIISCSCGKWLPTFQNLITHTEVDKSCQPQCYGCGTKLTSNAETINNHFVNKSLCKSVYIEPPSSVLKARKPSYLTSRCRAYPSILKCHICTEKFDNCTDECTVSHFIKKHEVVKTIAERIIDTALAAPVIDDYTNLELPQCFVCEASVNEVVEFKSHLENHKDVMMLYECPFCFSLHETQPALLFHVSKCSKSMKCSIPPAGSIIPLLFRKNNNSMLEMVPLSNANEVRALQIMRTLSTDLQQTDQHNSDSKGVISNEQKNVPSATNIIQVDPANKNLVQNSQPSVATMQPPPIGAAYNFPPPPIITRPFMPMPPFPMTFPPPHFRPSNLFPFPPGPPPFGPSNPHLPPPPFRPPGPYLPFEENIDKNQYVCFDCHKTLNSAISLKGHLSSFHNIILKWQCSQCPTWHEYRSSLEMHLRNSHKMNESPAAILSMGLQPNFVRGEGDRYNTIVHNFLKSKTFHQALRQIQEVSQINSNFFCDKCGLKLTNKRDLKLHLKNNCESRFDSMPNPPSSKHREHSTVKRLKDKRDIGDGLALCPFCKVMKSSHKFLVSHLIKEHHVKKGPASIMSDIMYSGKIPKSDLIPQSYTCRKCYKKMSDPVRIKDHSEKHGIRLRFLCPECSQLKPTTSELAVHLVEQHDADFSYAVAYTSGTEPVLAKTKHGQERMFECEDTLLYFLRQTQYTDITLPDNTVKRPQREYSWSPTSEDSYSSDDSYINDSPSTNKPVSTKPWWRKSEDREISPSYSMISSTFSDDRNLSDVGAADEPHRRRRDSLSPRDERKTRKRERDVSPVYSSTSKFVQDRTGLHRLAKDTLDTYHDANARDSDRYSNVNNRQKLIKRELLSSQADLEGMLSRAGSAVTGRVKMKEHDGRDRETADHYDRDLFGDERPSSTKTTAHYDRDRKKTTAYYERDLIGEERVTRDGYKVAPDRQETVRSPVDSPVTKLHSLHSLESGQSVIYNGKLFLVVKHIDSCLLRKT